MTERLQKLVDAVRALAAEYPDAMYKAVGGKCSYVSGEVINGPPGACGCIMKHAAVRAGDTNLLVSMTEHPTSIIGDVLGDRSVLSNVEVRSVQWLRYVQRRQDDQTNRMTWGQAVVDTDEAWIIHGP